MSERTFQPSAIDQVERSWAVERPRGDDDLHARLDYEVESANYVEGTIHLEMDLRVTFVAYTIASDGSDSTFARLTAKWAVQVEADAPISEAEVEEGALESVQPLVNAWLHPYIRQQIEGMCAEARIPVYKLPINYAQLEVLASEEKS